VLAALMAHHDADRSGAADAITLLTEDARCRGGPDVACAGGCSPAPRWRWWPRSWPGSSWSGFLS